MEATSESLRVTKGSHFQWSDLLAGGLCAIVTLAYASGFGTLIFGGVLAPHSSQGVLAAIICSVITLLALSVRSSFSFAMGGPDSTCPPLNSTTSRERIWGWNKPREAINATRKEGTG